MRRELDTLSRSARVAVAAASIRGDGPLIILDGALVAFSYLVVLLARFDGSVPAEWWPGFRRLVPVALVVFVVSHFVWGLYGQMWRHASVREARQVVFATLTGGLVVAVLFAGGRPVPMTVLLLAPVIAMTLVGALRFQSRLFAFRRGFDREATRVIVIGAGESGAAIVREMLRTDDGGLRPVAVLDDDPRKHNRSLAGVPIVGDLSRLDEVARRFSADQALLAIPSADSEVVRRVANLADRAGLPLKTLPSVSEIVNGHVSVRDVRDLRIEDLLGRQQIATDLDAVRRLLTGRRVLITGAGGSIGSEIARQVHACEPETLLLLDHDETHVFEAAGRVNNQCVQLLADVRDAERIDRIMRRHRPHVVFHAAAHKHVPLLEAHPCEAFDTNVRGTVNLVNSAARHDVERLVFISTDKAVRPQNVMGASKRLGEQVVLAGAPMGARYCAVRFGNVLGSRGSVIPVFMDQIKRGGPVTVTDPRMMRYFMSIPEAVQLVLQAAVFAEGGEIFMLEMGQPVRIMELAERMIRLSGRQVGQDVAIRVVGSRPGEKLAEELRAPEERPKPTMHPSITKLELAPLDADLLKRGLDRLSGLSRQRDDDELGVALRELASRDGSGLAVGLTTRSPLLNRSSA